MPDNAMPPAGPRKMKVDPVRRAEIGRERREKTRARIIAAGLRLFSRQAGVDLRVEDVAKEAGVTRATLYNHFNGMAELREALNYDLTHDFLVAVTEAIYKLDDPLERASVAMRSYLHRARNDANWSMANINLSSDGVMFGRETSNQAETTIKEAMQAGLVTIPVSLVGRDIVVGASLAAMATMLTEETGEDYPEQVVEYVLLGLGVEKQAARRYSRCDLPQIVF